MRGVDFQTFETAISFIERFKQSESITALTRTILEAAATFGYRNFSIIAGPQMARPDFEERIMLMHWPDDWLRQYVHENFQDHDPVVQHARSQAHSFYWTQAPYDVDQAKRSRVMDCAARDYNMSQGLCVPIYGMNGYEGSVNFGGPDIDNSTPARAAMELMAMYAVNSLSRLRAADKEAAAVLSMREKEVLTWAAVGKTAWDTGRILQISTDTVNKHIASAMRKLDSFSKTQAVAESLRRGEIQI